MTPEEREFLRECSELGEKLIEITFLYPKRVGICVIPAVMASIITALGIPRDTIVSVLDSALEDLKEKRDADPGG